jgi:hypothetical protein
MQPLRRAFAIACVPAALSAQAKFEGSITARMSAAAGNADVTYFVKGDQFRMDIAGPRGGGMYILRDQSKNTTYMVMPQQRMYMDMPAPSLAETTPEAKNPNIKMTGRKETVAGIECEHVEITSDGSQYDACVAHGLGMFPMVNNPMGRGRGEPPPAWQKLGRDAFPLKVQRAGEQITFEVTKIERKSLDASLFAVPDGFQSMGAMGRGRPPR